MRRGADRAREGMRPGGTQVLLVSLLLAVSATGCGTFDLDESIDSLALQLEGSIQHRHDTAGHAGRGTMPRHLASVPESVPSQRYARVRGTLLAGLAVSRESDPRTVENGQRPSPPGLEAPPPSRQVRSTGHPKQVPNPGVGSALARTRAPAPEGVARMPKAVHQGTRWGVARGRDIRMAEPAHLAPVFPGEGMPSPLLAHAETVSAPARIVTRRSSPASWAERLEEGGQRPGGPRPEHAYASARPGRVARARSTAPGWALAGPGWGTLQDDSRRRETALVSGAKGRALARHSRPSRRPTGRPWPAGRPPGRIRMTTASPLGPVPLRERASGPPVYATRVSRRGRLHAASTGVSHWHTTKERHGLL